MAVGNQELYNAMEAKSMNCQPKNRKSRIKNRKSYSPLDLYTFRPLKIMTIVLYFFPVIP